MSSVGRRGVSQETSSVGRRGVSLTADAHSANSTCYERLIQSWPGARRQTVQLLLQPILPCARVFYSSPRDPVRVCACAKLPLSCEIWRARYLSVYLVRPAALMRELVLWGTAWSKTCPCTRAVPSTCAYDANYFTISTRREPVCNEHIIRMRT